MVLSRVRTLKTDHLLLITKRRGRYGLDVGFTIFAIVLGAVMVAFVTSSAGGTTEYSLFIVGWAAFILLCLGVAVVGALRAARESTEDFALCRKTNRFLRNREVLARLSAIREARVYMHTVYAGRQRYIKWWEVRVALDDGREICIVDGLPESEATRVAELIGEHTGARVIGAGEPVEPLRPHITVVGRD